MTATTTLKLPDELKARIAAVAQQSGKSAHAFMVEALELQLERKLLQTGDHKE